MVTDFRQAIINHLQHHFPQLFQIVKLVRIDYAEALGQYPVAHVLGCPDGEVVAEFRIIESRPQLRLAEVVKQTFQGTAGYPFPQFAEADGGLDAPHAGNQRAVFNLKRHIDLFGFPDHSFTFLISLLVSSAPDRQISQLADVAHPRSPLLYA